MKWPASVTFIRHGESRYNVLRELKRHDPNHIAFLAEYERDYRSARARELATLIRARYALDCSDALTPLTPRGHEQALATGRRLHEIIPTPDVIFFSPYLRAVQTDEGVTNGWPDLRRVPHVEDDRIREQGHGLALLYSDWRVYHVFHPEQRELRDLLGPYWYQFPQGESVPQVRDRGRDFLGMLSREYAGQHVLVHTHHLTILSTRANLERLPPDEFVRLDEEEKPINCGVTHYVGQPNLGKNGKLVLQIYNERLYD